jgi:hypothetical protein
MATTTEGQKGLERTREKTDTGRSDRKTVTLSRGRPHHYYSGVRKVQDLKTGFRKRFYILTHSSNGVRHEKQSGHYIVPAHQSRVV